MLKIVQRSARDINVTHSPMQLKVIAIPGYIEYRIFNY